VGPVSLKGIATTFTGSNLATFIESTEYSVFRGPDQGPRKKFISRVAGAVLAKLLSGAGDPSAIASALGSSAGAGHLSLWSDRSAEQAVISGTPLAGAVPRTTSPYLGVAVNNAAGTKLDYYLDRSVSYRVTSCTPDHRRDVTESIRLLNAAPRHGLPPYVLIRGDLGTGSTSEKVPQNRDAVFIHVTQGAVLTDASLDGQPLRVGSGTEEGHPVYYFNLTLDPGAVRTVRLQLSEPLGGPGVIIPAQPLRRPQQTSVDTKTCT
jgi:hypothetical protein